MVKWFNMVKIFAENRRNFNYLQFQKLPQENVQLQYKMQQSWKYIDNPIQNMLLHVLIRCTNFNLRLQSPEAAGPVIAQGRVECLTYLNLFILSFLESSASTYFIFLYFSIFGKQVAPVHTTTSISPMLTQYQIFFFNFIFRLERSSNAANFEN